MNDLRLRGKSYAIGVINELERNGYSESNARKVFLRHYRGLKRIYGLNLNVFDFAKVIDEIEHSVNRKFEPDDPNLIYIGHMRNQLEISRKQTDLTGSVFQITDEMEQKINEWDSCIPEDVNGAQYAYTFIPTGQGLVIKVQCDVCKRELDLSAMVG
jgi:hypothetical protein